MKKLTRSLSTLALCLSLFLSTAVPALAAAYPAEPAADETAVLSDSVPASQTQEDDVYEAAAAAADAKVFLTGSRGSAESTGIFGGVPLASQWAAQKYHDYSLEVDDSVTWTLKDGVLTLSGNGATADANGWVDGSYFVGVSPFDGNEHIRVILVEEGITALTGAPFWNLPNLETVIFMSGSTDHATAFSNCPKLETILIGANLKDDYRDIHGWDIRYPNKTILLTKNFSFGGIHNGATLRDDIIKPPAGWEIDIYELNVVSRAQIIALAHNALEGVPQQVLDKLPRELTDEPQSGLEEPEEPQTGGMTAAGGEQTANSLTHLRTSYSANNYLDLSISGDTLTVTGRLLVDRLSKVQVSCGTQSARTETAAGQLFSLSIPLRHSGAVSMNFAVYQGYSAAYEYVGGLIYIEKTAGGYQFMPSLIQENNTAYEGSYVDPETARLGQNNVPASVAAMSDAIVGGETDDYAKVFLLHKWVAENIYYDYDAFANPLLRTTNSAKVLEDRRGVCAGYSALLRDLILAQGIPAIYSANDATYGSYALRENGGIAHAHTEAYVDGRWITMDATWDSLNQYRGGTYTARAPIGYFYFDLSSEVFALDHKITGRAGDYSNVTDADGFVIRLEDGALVDYKGNGGDITIPGDITVIESLAFQGCTNITSVVIPDGVTVIGDNAFKNCSGLTSIAIPDSVREIGDYAFAGCTSLTSVVIPDGVTAIGERSFQNCSALESVVFPNSLTTIGHTSFYGCAALKEVTIPGGVQLTMMDQAIFYNCPGLERVTIEEGFTYIPPTMFYNCKSLTDISLPASLTYVGDGAFRGCTSLADVYYGGSASQWGSLSVKSNNTPLQTADIHYNGAAPEQPEQPKPLKQPEQPEPSKQPEQPEPSKQPQQPEQPAVQFADVPASEYYAGPVRWAIENEITNGTTATTFSPDDTCTTAQILTFLYRAAGSPEVGAAGSVSNVTASDYYYNPANWANGLGMIGAAAFDPNTPCTRAATVMFLWQAAGSPTVNTRASFTDVPAGSDYAMAVAWAVENGVTNGTSDTTFSPNDTCTRGQIVTFLYRAFAA